MATRSFSLLFLVVAAMLVSAQGFALCQYQCNAARLQADCSKPPANTTGAWNKDDPVYIMAACGTCCDTVPPTCTNLVVAVPSIEIGGVSVQGTLDDTGKTCNGAPLYKLNNANGGKLPPGKYKTQINGLDMDTFSSASPCTGPGDCAADKCTTCTGGYCMFSPSYCTANGDCKEGVTCNINAADACMNLCSDIDTTCKTVSECAGQCQQCLNSKCVPQDKYCGSQDDCKVLGETCFQSATSDMCISKCYTSTTAPKCTTNADCPYKCTTCNGGKCGLPADYCASQKACAPGSLCYSEDKADMCKATCHKDPTWCSATDKSNCGCFDCDVANSKCLTGVAPVACKTNADCSGGKVCINDVSNPANGTCGACNANWQCSAGTVCKGTAGMPCTFLCVGCTVDTDCGGCDVCNKGVCAAPTAGCASDLDCGAGKYCDKAATGTKAGCGGSCKACPVCSQDADCGAGLTCFPPATGFKCGKCGAADDGPPCVSSADCGDACLVCGSANKCEKAKAGCAKDTDCKTGELCLLPADAKACQVKQCITAECTTSDQCKDKGDGCNDCSGAPKYLCNVPKVAKCNADSDCKDPTPHCKTDAKSCNNVCVPTPCAKDKPGTCPMCSTCQDDGTCGPVSTKVECTAASAAQDCKLPGQICNEVPGAACLNKCSGGVTADADATGTPEEVTGTVDKDADVAGGELPVAPDVDGGGTPSDVDVLLPDVPVDEKDVAAPTSTAKKSTASCTASHSGTAGWPLLVLAAAALVVLRRRQRA